MELKKSPKADLERNKRIFLMLGLVLALGIVFAAFEWKTKPTASTLGTLDAAEVEEEVIPITRQDQPPPPPPPPPPPVIEVLNIVDDSVEILDDLSIFDSEADMETFIDVAPVIQTVREEEEEEAQVFFIVEDMPEFPGGEAALRSFIASAVRYPQIAQENGIQGRVYVQFVVDRDGSVTNATIARGVDPSLDREALRVVNTLPKWRPGRQRGQPVRVSYTVPINFQLQ